ncbi:FAD-binding oxidoreductase [Dethiosulfatarculus sandiegensis]|uniref:FAD-binding protein n=1 Tax=Dethiosulfatarculus sandiegensis TaxID=1429043 RepID=A0A0D2JIN0_9BACT|nr:FAD-linked oxidase C-terminal domain-containing protein [Dethiosulfatarculus sandiegensis]KIX15511.1 FAD-binding protein [Dethiosulfatarculus sandiegensis]
MSEKLYDFLEKTVGKDLWTKDLIDLVSYSSDASLNKNRPEAGVWPETAEQVAAILAFCNREKIPVTPRGAGTGLTGLAVPVQGGLVMDLGRMDKILKVSLDDRLAVVQPGVVYAALEEALDPYGFFFPPDPASGKVATLGGNVATNAGGMKGAKYGTTKDYVLGLQVALPDGRLMRTGSNTMKTSSGYNLTQLFVGCEGTLGVVTEITLKINPRPTANSTALATFDKMEQAGRAVTDIMKSGIIPSVLEIIDNATLVAINQNSDMGLPEVGGMLLVETDGYTQGETEYQLEKVIDLFKKNGALEVRKAASDEEAQSLWLARKSSYAVISRISNALLVEDMAVPMSQVAYMLAYLDDLAARHKVRIATVGHAGDGNLHPTICFDGTDEEEVKRVHAASKELFKKVVEVGGTLTGEHGIGMDKAPYMSLEHDQAAMETMRGLKKFFDPNNILNPDKMSV